MQVDPHSKDEDAVVGVAASASGGDTSVVASIVGDGEDGEGDDVDDDDDGNYDDEEEDSEDGAVGGADQVIAIESSGSESE